jgi:hypothetical protein
MLSIEIVDPDRGGETITIAPPSPPEPLPGVPGPLASEWQASRLSHGTAEDHQHRAGGESGCYLYV